MRYTPNCYYKTIVSYFLLGVISLLSACGGGSSPSVGTPITPSSLTINPQVNQFAKGTSQQFAAIVQFSNGTTLDPSNSGS
ncbi:hypothetical protein [Zhongshania aliphaticivorans]|uniref:hypothetical protein n=1 Tax=Zhongshania aliphaticivorans TaxID=1470434 RepID=UPI0039C99B06